MKTYFAIFRALSLGAITLASSVSAQTAASPGATAAAKIAVIDIQAAIIQTRDGQKAAADLKTKFTPKQTELAKKQQDIAGLQEQLRKANVMSDEAKQKIMRDIDLKNTSLKRDTEDANADLEQEQQRIMGDLGGKMISVLNKYATENGFVLVLDISSQQTPVLFASNTIDITRDIIALYDKTAPNFAAPPNSRISSPPAPRPLAPATPRPSTPAPATSAPVTPAPKTAAPK